MTDQATSRQEWLRALPSVDALLRTETARSLRDRLGAQRLTALARAVTDDLRASLQADTAHAESGDHPLPSRELLLAEATRRLERASVDETAMALRRVVNASGVVLHTN
ncbi:MAG: hypothetical protein WCF57_05065, partial [Pyrinomonadaceae bacterium]